MAHSSFSQEIEIWAIDKGQESINLITENEEDE
jgi:hypothetical protein